MGSEKTRKKRGSKTCGRGSKKKHRGSGSRGGAGYAGSMNHKKVGIAKYEKDHLGKRGFVSKTGNKMRCINVGELEKLASGKKTVNVAEFGFDKVLGKGVIGTALTVSGGSFTPKAMEKIAAAGGKAESS